MACISRSEILGTTSNGEQNIVCKQLHSLGNFVDGNRAGLIVTGNGRQTFDAIAALTAMFPESPIAIVVASHAEGDLVASEMKKRVPETVHRAYGFEAVIEPRITVATYLAWNSMYFWGVPFLIVPFWKPNYPLWMKQLTLNPYLDRAYFFRMANETLSDREADDFEGRVGPSLSLGNERLHHRRFRYFSTYEFGGAGSKNGRRHLIGISRETINQHKLYSGSSTT